MALTMLDRARWTGKLEEAEIYRRWLVGKLNAPLTSVADAKAEIKDASEEVQETIEKVRLRLAA
jgi:hypothetical protein